MRMKKKKSDDKQYKSHDMRIEYEKRETMILIILSRKKYIKNTTCTRQNTDRQIN